MEIIITDVTDMSDGHICIAGWSPEEERMVRPLHADGYPHWMENMARDDLLCPGNIINVEPSRLPPNRRNPHAAEDCLISGKPTLTGRISPEEMVEAVSGSIHG